MANNAQQDQLRLISSGAFERAKRFWRYSLFCKASLFAIGLISILFNLFPSFVPILILILEVISELLSWNSDNYKDKSEYLLRKLDFRDSLGWQISRSELSDLYIESENLQDDALDIGVNQSYFSSTEEDDRGRRLLENIQESAWWSKHLTRRMYTIYFYSVILLTFVSMSLLLFTILNIEKINNQVVPKIGEISISILMLIFSLNIIRTVFAYSNFYQQCKDTEETIENLLESTESIEIEKAIKIVHEYQICRNTAPLIPSFIYERMKQKLNEKWQQRRAVS